MSSITAMLASPLQFRAIAIILLVLLAPLGFLQAQDAAKEEAKKASPSSQTMQGTKIEMIEENISGEVIGIQLSEDSAPQLLLKSKKVPLRNVLRLEYQALPKFRREILLELSDGSQLYGGIGDGSNDSELVFHCRLFPKGIAVPLEWVRKITYTSPAASTQNQPMSTVFPKGLNEDALITAKGALLKGVLESVDPEKVHFSDASLGLVSLAWGRVRSIQVAALGENPSHKEGSLLAALEGVGGSYLKVAVLALNKEEVEFKSALLGKNKVKLDRIHAIGLGLDRVRYLSGIDPKEVVESAPKGFGFHWPYKRDANVHNGGPITIGEQRFRRGLGVHSKSALTYELSEKDLCFQTFIGMDGTSKPADGNPKFASVIFKVYLDDKLTFDSGNFNWQQPAKKLSIKLEGAKKLKLVVELGEGMHVLDRANWADAKILQK